MIMTRRTFTARSGSSVWLALCGHDRLPAVHVKLRADGEVADSQGKQARAVTDGTRRRGKRQVIVRTEMREPPAASRELACACTRYLSVGTLGMVGAVPVCSVCTTISGVETGRGQAQSLLSVLTPGLRIHHRASVTRRHYKVNYRAAITTPFPSQWQTRYV